MPCAGLEGRVHETQREGEGHPGGGQMLCHSSGNWFSLSCSAQAAQAGPSLSWPLTWLQSTALCSVETIPPPERIRLKRRVEFCVKRRVELSVDGRGAKRLWRFEAHVFQVAIRRRALDR